MIRERAAMPLGVDEDPIERYYRIKEQASNILERDEVYGTFDHSAIESIAQTALNH